MNCRTNSSEIVQCRDIRLGEEWVYGLDERLHFSRFRTSLWSTGN